MSIEKIISVLAGCCLLAFPISGNAETPIHETLREIPYRTLYPTDGALANAFLFDLPPLTGKKQIEAGLGTDHRDWQSVLLEQMLTDSFGIGLFGARETAEGADYDDNDFDRETAGAHLQYHTFDTQLDFMVLHQKKKFGARSYYGENPALPANEETEDTLLFLNARRGDLSADYLRGGLSWHEFHDDYALPTVPYRNRYRSRISRAFFDGRTLEINQWAFAWEAELEEEQITGDLGNRRRTQGGLSLLPEWCGDRLKIMAGLRAEFFTDEPPAYLPQAGIDWRVGENHTVYASYAESIRLPSYTELHYDSPGSLGNAGLKAQKTQQSEVGVKGLPTESFDWRIALFHRRSHDTIDWQQAAPGARWTAASLGTVNTFGAKAEAGWYPAQNVDVQLAYTWFHKDKEADDFGAYASRYALDYPEHLARASVLWRPVGFAEIGTVQTLRWQTDNRVRENGGFGILGSLALRVTPPCADFLTCSLVVNNLWDDDFQAFPGQRPADRSISVVFSTEF